VNDLRSIALFVACLTLPLGYVVVSERAASTRMQLASDAAADVPIASAAEDTYCTAQLKQVVRRVAGACGLLESGARGCKPADAKAVASLTGDDFNALFKPLANRARQLEGHAPFSDDLRDACRRDLTLQKTLDVVR